MRCSLFKCGGKDPCDEEAAERYLWPGREGWSHVCRGHASGVRKLAMAISLPLTIEDIPTEALQDVEAKIVCIPRSWGNPGNFDDNRYSPCARCGVEVQYRPHSPEPSEKVCIVCFSNELLPTDKVSVTAETLTDIERFRETES